MRKYIKINYNNDKDDEYDFDDNSFIYLDNDTNIEDIPKDIIFLRISFSDFESFDCRLFPKLEILYLTYNNLKEFIPSTTLKKLDLKFNYLEKLNLTNAENLETLDVSHNNLKDIILNNGLKSLIIENFYEFEWFMDDEPQFYYRHNYNRIDKLICNDKLEELLIYNSYDLYLENIIFNDNLKTLIIDNIYSKYDNFKFPINLKKLEIYNEHFQKYIIPTDLDIYYNENNKITQKISSRRRIYMIQESKEKRICPLCKHNINVTYKLNYRYLENGFKIIFSCC